jgi:hypothetical protein
MTVWSQILGFWIFLLWTSKMTVLSQIIKNRISWLTSKNFFKKVTVLSQVKISVIQNKKWWFRFLT